MVTDRDERLEYRPIPDDREEAFSAILRYAFSPDRGPFDPDEYDELPPPSRPGERRGLFDGDDLVSVCKHYFFDSRVRGTELTLAGLAAVATPPEHRRRGLVRRLASESLAEYRERGAPLAALWPFEHRFYARLGWATANRYAVSECPPETLSGARDAVAGAGEFVRLAPDDHGRMAEVLAATDRSHDLAVDRTEEWWRTRVFEGWGGEPYVYGWERDGELRGYLVYTVEDGDGDGLRLDASEIAAADHEAWLACLGFLADHDSQVERVRTYGPRDGPLVDTVDEPGDVETTIHAGPMVRIVSVRGALESIGFPVDADGRLVVGVEDGLADWNHGSYRVVVTDGTATVEPAAGDPDVEVGIGPLSQLAVGYRTAESLAAAGELSGDRDAIETLARLFPPREPFLRERF